MNFWGRVLEFVEIFSLLFSFILFFKLKNKSINIYLFLSLMLSHSNYLDIFRKDNYYHEKDQVFYLISCLLLIVYTCNIRNWFTFVLFFLAFVCFEYIELDFFGAGHVFYFYSASILVFIWVGVYFWRYILPKYDLHHLAVLTISALILSFQLLLPFYLLTKTNAWVNNWVFEFENIFSSFLMLLLVSIFIKQYKNERAIKVGS